TSEDIARKVADRLEEIVPQLPRKEIITESLENKGMIVLVDQIEEGIEIANQIAPEHLELLVKDESVISQIRNAGAIFVGQWSPEPAGDYFAGPNHILPTNGAAKYASALSVQDFQKHSSFIRYSKERIQKQGPMIAHFAELEELYAHAEAIKARF
ncbi:MAG TPA: histidinol dehydrogenase, partial [Desulfobacterales bacterium]|nr:histidinol dehydrogenase [Desulfobacterales bacterium]